MASTHEVKVGKYMEVSTTVVKTISQLDQSLGELLSNISSNLTPRLRPIIALDIQKHYYQDDSKGKRQVAVLKLCFNTTCLIIQLLHIEEPPCSLAEFFQMQELSFVGVGIKHCLDALNREYGLMCRNAVDLSMLAATEKNDKYKSFGLLDLAYELEVIKGYCWIWHKVSAPALGNWGAATLSQQQIKAATWGVFLCSCVGDHLLRGAEYGYTITLNNG